MDNFGIFVTFTSIFGTFWDCPKKFRDILQHVLIFFGTIVVYLWDIANIYGTRARVSQYFMGHSKMFMGHQLEGPNILRDILPYHSFGTFLIMGLGLYVPILYGTFYSSILVGLGLETFLSLAIHLQVSPAFYFLHPRTIILIKIIMHDINSNPRTCVPKSVRSVLCVTTERDP